MLFLTCLSGTNYIILYNIKTLMGTLFSLIPLSEFSLPLLNSLPSLQQWLPTSIVTTYSNNNNDMEYKNINITYQDSKVIRNVQGIFTNEKLSIDDKLINDELRSCEDPLFPLDELVSFANHSSFETIFDNFCNRYVKQSNSSNIYNLEHERYYFVVTQNVEMGNELLLRQGIQYWLVEVLKLIPRSKHLLWCQIASKYAGRELKDLISTTQTSYLSRTSSPTS
jgi:hypothetical protein